MGRIALPLARLASLGLPPRLRPHHLHLHHPAIPTRRQSDHPPAHPNPTHRRRQLRLLLPRRHGPLHAHLLPALLLPGRQRHLGRRLRHPLHPLPRQHHAGLHRHRRLHHHIRLVHALHVVRGRHLHDRLWYAVYAARVQWCGPLDRVPDPDGLRGRRGRADPVYRGAGSAEREGHAYGE